jgi:hypothetical protein
LAACGGGLTGGGHSVFVSVFTPIGPSVATLPVNFAGFGGRWVGGVVAVHTLVAKQKKAYAGAGGFGPVWFFTCVVEWFWVGGVLVGCVPGRAGFGGFYRLWWRGCVVFRFRGGVAVWFSPIPRLMDSTKPRTVNCGPEKA